MPRWTDLCAVVLSAMLAACAGSETDEDTAAAGADIADSGSADPADAPAASADDAGEHPLPNLPRALPALSSLSAVPGDTEVDVLWAVSPSILAERFRVRYRLGETGPPWPHELWVSSATGVALTGLENGVPVFIVVQVGSNGGQLGPESPVVQATPQAQIGSLVRIDEGPFMMGWDGGLEDEDESPAHVVWLSSYWIDRYPVTTGQLRACIEADACQPPSRAYGFVHGVGLAEDLLSDPAHADHPAVFLSWYLAKQVCAFRGLRLPTEAEWEKAARGPGPDLYPYPWGGDEPTCAVASHATGGAPCTSGTEPVGSRVAGRSPYGLLDMAGGAWEWTADWYAADAYATHASKDPTGPAAGEAHVVRGGAWNEPPETLYTTARRPGPSSFPDTGDPKVDYAPYGVRCAADAVRQ